MTQPGNLLSGEKSPYLLQHADNPVNWHPWGEEAFRKAREEDKPLFVSIGYATCHWCHVMERESFSDGEVANLLNDACVPVKVDREERPDIDGNFMAVCQMMNGSGGWPLNVFLTPEGLPFFAATYLPKRGATGRPGMVDMVPRVKWLWKTQREQVMKSARSIRESLLKEALPAAGACPGQAQVKAAFDELSRGYDPQWGGFSKEPKFPMPSLLLFLFHYWKRFGEGAALSMARNTLSRIWSGGIHDHLGGGIARYATDRRWVLPHFEKMLYDQALLLHTVAEFHREKPDPLFVAFAEDLAGFVLREMTSPEGGFYSAFDADSEGEEGKYYLWTEEQIRNILSPEDAGVFLHSYGVLRGGNFKNEVTGRILGDNVLYMAVSPAETAARFSLEPEELGELLSSCREKLLAERRKRPAPLLDDKILADWNGLMIAGLSLAGTVFGRKEWVTAAEKAARFIDLKLREKTGRLLHRYRDRDAAIPGFLDDYAFLAWGLAEIGAATGKKEYVLSAAKLMDILLEDFADRRKGGFFPHGGQDANLFLRRKEAYDGAIPSGNAVAMANFIRLAGPAGRKDFPGHARRIGEAFSEHVSKYPLSHAHLLTAVMMF
ncbi:MAG: thioredoxin domain-containing protein [Aminivibrio sp.]|nr:thioredoxin domain-containing protein [Aminivibrio sp.]